MQLLDRVRRYLRRHRLAGAETRVLAAVSGGSDSVALVHLLRDLHASGDLTLAGIVHVNHQLREDAGRDEAFCKALARTLDLPIELARVDVADYARRTKRSIEDAAHVLRYDAFARAREAQGAACVALGHTRDDQAETVLLRLVRGAGARGLAGMYPRHDGVIRPLLDCGRQELRDELTARGQAFVDDATNEDVRVPRNRVRAELMPLLQARFNPSIVEVLAAEATLARESWDWMEQASDEWYRRVVAERRVDLGELAGAPPALGRLVLWRVLCDGAGGRPVTFGHVDDVLGLVEGERDGMLDLPGQRVQRIGQMLVLKPGAGARRARARHS